MCYVNICCNVVGATLTLGPFRPGHNLCLLCGGILVNFNKILGPLYNRSLTTQQHSQQWHCISCCMCCTDMVNTVGHLLCIHFCLFRGRLTYVWIMLKYYSVHYILVILGAADVVVNMQALHSRDCCFYSRPQQEFKMIMVLHSSLVHT